MAQVSAFKAMGVIPERSHILNANFTSNVPLKKRGCCTFGDLI